MKNPFLIKTYHSPKYFCDRKEETQALSDAITNGRNVTLFALRRLGKTGLIHHVFNKLRKDNWECYYVDIMFCNNIKQLANKMTIEILQKLHDSPMSIIEKASKVLKHLRANVVFDQITGMPQLELGIGDEKMAENTLESLFDYIDEYSRKKKKVVIAIDEFQQIINFPEKNVEALLRSKIQHMSNTQFIFSGSQQQMLSAMFGNVKRPFYRSTEMMNLKHIPKEAYKKFIKRNFKNGGYSIDNYVIDQIFNETRLHTYYVQYVCNKLYNLEKNITEQDVVMVLKDIILEQESIFYNYRNLLTEEEWKLLKAVAVEGGVAHPMSRDFLHIHELSGASTVRACLERLKRDEFIYHEEGKYYVYDVFFDKFLKQQN